LASLPALRAVLHTYEQRGATDEQWIWLARRLAEMREQITVRHIDVDARLFPLVHLIMAYCLSQLSPPLAAASPNRALLVRRLLDKAATTRSSLNPRISIPAPLESTLSAVLYARLGEWEAAKRSMYGAFTTGNLKDRYHRLDLRFLQYYHSMLERNKRLDDFYEIITKKADGIVNALSKQDVESEGGGSGVAFVRPELGRTLFALIGRIERVDGWYAGVLRNEEQSGAKIEERVAAESAEGRVRSDLKLSKSVRALGSLLFMAFSQKPERLEETQGLLRQLFYKRIWPPAHSVADYCEILTAVGRQNQVLEAYNRLSRVQGEWSAPLLRRFISILLRNELAVEADELHAELVRLPSATSRDRTMVAFYYAQTGNVDAVEENLQRTFGSDWLKVIESLAMLLEVWLIRKTRAKVKRFVGLIAKFARTQTSHLNFLINHYAQTGQVAEGLTVFNSFLDRRRGNKPNLGTFSALIRLFSRQGDSRNVDRIVQGAVESGIVLDGPFCAQIIEAGIRTQDWLTISRRWTAFPPDIKSHPYVVAAVMKAFVYLAVPYDFVLSYFGSIEKPIHSHWHMIILSACDARKMLDAEKLLLAMERRALHQPAAPRPDKFIYATVMHGYLRLNQMDHAEQTFNRMAARKLVPTGVTFAMMLDAFDRNYSATNTVEQAYRFSVTVFERQHRGVQRGDQGHGRRFARYNFYSRLIRMAGARGMRRRVDALYHEATKNLEPSIATQTVVMQAYFRMGHTRSAQRLWADIYQRALRVIGTGPSAHHAQVPQSNVLCQALTMILRMTGDAGEHDKVMAIWEDVSSAGFGLDSSSYNAYAHALAKTGNIDGALHVLEHVLLPRAAESETVVNRMFGAAGGLESLTVSEEDVSIGLDDAAAPGSRGGAVGLAQAAGAGIAPSSVPTVNASATGSDASNFWKTDLGIDSAVSSAPQSPSAGDLSSSSPSVTAATPPSSTAPGSINTMGDLQPFSTRYLAPTYRPPSSAFIRSQNPTNADPPRPSERRPEERSTLQTTPMNVDGSAVIGSDALTRDVLEHWRPGIVSWIPSPGLRSVLCALFSQLEWQARRAQSGSASEHGESSEATTLASETVGPINLRKGAVDIPLRSRNGSILHRHPAEILAKYRQRYPRAMGMIDGLRAEQAAGKGADDIKMRRRKSTLVDRKMRDTSTKRKPRSHSVRVRSPRSAIPHLQPKALSANSRWRSLEKWQEVMQSTPEQWAQLKAGAERRRMANVSRYKGNWSLLRPSPPVGKRARPPTMAEIKAEEDEEKRAQLARELEAEARTAERLAKKAVVERERTVQERRKIRPRVYGLEAERRESELKERGELTPEQKKRRLHKKRWRAKQLRQQAEEEQARRRERGGSAA